MEMLSAFERMTKAALPERTESYTPISHSTIDENTKLILKQMGFSISNIHYRSSLDGLVGQAEYHLNFGNDPEMGLMVAWQNSYNKAVSFKYAVGAHVFVCANGCVGGDLGAYRRKHTGSADIESSEIMRTYLYGAKGIFEKLIYDREYLKKINLEPSEMAAIMGRMFIHNEIITSTQINIMKRELQNPTYDYGVPKHNAWALYNFATHAFKEDTPKNWMKRHVDLHKFFSENFGIIPTPTEEFIPQEIPFVESPFIEGPEKDFEMIEVEVEEPQQPSIQEPSDELLDLLDLF